MLFGSSDLLEPPTIHQSGNGWIYKPDEARTPQEIRSGKNKAWPRDRTGRQYHAEWHQQYMQRQLANRQWVLPSKIGNPVIDKPRIADNTLAVVWKSEPWGWQKVELQIRDGRDSYYNRNANAVTLRYVISTHKAAIWYMERNVNTIYSNWGGMAETLSADKTPEDRDHARELVRKWASDPWGETLQAINANNLTDVIRPPIDKMVGLAFSDSIHDDEEFQAIATGHANFWREGTVERVMKDQTAWNELHRLLSGFRYLGYSVMVSMDYQNKEITGLSFEIPKDTKDLSRKSRQEGHTIKITRDGIIVECGFVTDEKRWIERETRKAKEQLASIETDLFTEFSIDLLGDHD